MKDIRYKRVMITHRSGVKIPAIKFELASDGEIFYLKTLNPQDYKKSVVIVDRSPKMVTAYIREDHPWFNFDLIKETFKMRSHALMITHFLIQLLGRDYLK